MEILSPSPPPSPSPSDGLCLRYRRGRREPHRGEALVHVAVGRSPEKTLGLLRWALRRFGGCRLALLHVHQPSPLIPTLLGKIPAGQATEELVLSHRKFEREEMNKILLSYLAFCHRTSSQVQAALLVTENDQIHDGIISLVNQYGITKLVMGSTPDNCFKLKATYGKGSLMARNAPAFCEIWFVWRGRHIWTREATVAATPIHTRWDAITTKRIRFSPESNNSAESILDEGYITCDTSIIAHLNQGIAPSDNDQSSDCQTLGRHMATTNWQATEDDFIWSDSYVSAHIETSKDILVTNLKQLTMEAEESRKEAFVELLKRKEIASKTAGAFSRVKASESATKWEIEIRGEHEVLLASTRKQHEELTKNKEKAVAGLHSSMRRIAILDARAKRVSLWMEEVGADLELIRSSIEILRQEPSKLHRVQGRYIDQATGFRELTLLDVQSATSKFSESSKTQSRSYGCVYKGEIMDRSVMIHKLHLHSIQSIKRFQQEVYTLSKLQHPHLVALVGACQEVWCLVYEQPPNGSLHEYLFNKCNSPPLSWNFRARIIAEISCALLFLHTHKPQIIIHGDLKLENIHLDTDFHCKVSGFGISQLFTDDTKDSELKGSFPYADPEYQRTRALTPKYDIYCFGVVILQLLTGQVEPVGLVNEVRRAVSCGNLSSVLDPTAGEWPMEVARRLAYFGLKCSEACSQDRPELTPGTVRDLEQLHLMRERRVPPSFLCPISQEIMHDPQVCADGLTYEAQAIRGWIESGQQTSPVTNLKLEHLNLTPNHALRFAIQDWLCHSH